MPGSHSSNSLYCVEHCRSLNAQHFLFCCVIFFVPRHVVFRNARSFSLSLFGNRIYERKNEKKNVTRPLLLSSSSVFSLSLSNTDSTSTSSTCTTERKWRELFVYCSYTTFLIVFNAHLKKRKPNIVFQWKMTMMTIKKKKIMWSVVCCCYECIFRYM